MEEYLFFAQSEDAGLRLDKYLALNLSEFSRNYIQTIIEEGHAFVNGKASKASKKLSLNDEIKILIEPPKEIDAVPVDIPIEILYEDSDVIVVNKPKGMPVHPSNGHYDDTLVNALLFSHKDELSGINGKLRPGIVHRIDMDTTGSLIVCKNDEAHRFIAKQIEDHSFNRVYCGIVHGKPKEDEFKIEAPIGRDEKNRLRMSINVDGKPAVTFVKVLDTFEGYSFCEFKLKTGRTHQIRVHLASIGNPILGDDKYGPRKCPFKLQGQCLHAKTLGFIRPSDSEYVEVNAPIPEYMTKLLSKMKNG